MASTSFDILSDLEENQQKKPIKPFWTLDFKDEENLKNWLTNAIDSTISSNRNRLEVQRMNIATYRGFRFMEKDTRNREAIDFQTTRRRQRMPYRVSVNHTYDMVEQHVSRETRYRPACNVMPASNEHKDRMNSIVVQKVLDATWDKENIDDIFQQHSRNSRILGDSYILCDFDKTKGDFHPDWIVEMLEQADEDVLKDNNLTRNSDPKKITAKQIYKLQQESSKKPRVHLVNPKTGEKIYGQDGEPLYIDKPVRIGEIKYRVLLSPNVFLQQKLKYEEVEWAFYQELIDIDEIKGLYPNRSHDIKPQRGKVYYDYNSMAQEEMGNRTWLYHFFHRQTPLLDSGRHVVLTPDAILANESLPYSDGDFPWVRRTDIDVPGLLKGVSVVEMTRSQQDAVNNISSMLLRGQALAAHPKWMMPVNSCKIESLGNDSTVVAYKGPVPPKLEQPNPGSAASFKLRDIEEQNMQKIHGVFGVSRGQPPAGIRAGVALQFLNEQENERANASIAKHNLNIKQLALKTVERAGENYDDSDDRLAKLLGPDDAHLSKDFQTAEFNRIYDIRVQTASALPQQKAARIQAIFDLKDKFPTKVNDDEALDMIGFGSADKFVSINTVNIRAAECENDDILRNGSTEDPEIYEDHVAHYRLHRRELSSKKMKTGDVPKSSVQALKEHIKTHEMYMASTAIKNPVYMQAILNEFPDFPLYYEMDYPMMATPMDSGVSGQQIGQMQDTMALAQNANPENISGPITNQTLSGQVQPSNEKMTEAPRRVDQ